MSFGNPDKFGIMMGAGKGWYTVCLLTPPTKLQSWNSPPTKLRGVFGGFTLSGVSSQKLFSGLSTGVLIERPAKIDYLIKYNHAYLEQYRLNFTALELGLVMEL